MLIYNYFRRQHLPFATDSTPISDLARFYRECFNAPPLSLERQRTNSGNSGEKMNNSDEVTLGDLNELPEDEEDEEDDGVDELTRQLDRFETSLGDYDTLMTSLCTHSEIDSNSNS